MAASLAVSLCPQKLFNEEDVSLDTSVSLLSAVKAQPASGRQVLTKCNCSGTPIYQSAANALKQK